MDANEDNDMNNTKRSITYPGIYLVPTGNIQGTLKVFGLNTGIVKNPRSDTDFNIPDRIIELVNSWGKIYHKE